jgi:hypothetical protein
MMRHTYTWMPRVLETETPLQDWLYGTSATPPFTGSLTAGGVTRAVQIRANQNASLYAVGFHVNGASIGGLAAVGVWPVGNLTPIANEVFNIPAPGGPSAWFVYTLNTAVPLSPNNDYRIGVLQTNFQMDYAASYSWGSGVVSNPNAFFTALATFYGGSLASTNLSYPNTSDTNNYYVDPYVEQTAGAVDPWGLPLETTDSPPAPAPVPNKPCLFRDESMIVNGLNGPIQYQRTRLFLPFDDPLREGDYVTDVMDPLTGRVFVAQPSRTELLTLTATKDALIWKQVTIRWSEVD